MIAIKSQLDLVNDLDLLNLGLNSFNRVVAPRIRPITQFAAEEINVPRGRFKGKFKIDRKPATRLWLNEIDSGRWQTHNYTGPSQSGKTLDGFLTPILWCLFEKEEDVCIGISDMNMSEAKFRKDIEPIIQKTKYSRFLPTKGVGSRGGKIKEVKFGNGAWLTFMSFGGGDKTRAHDTFQNLIITETDGGDDASEASDEGSKIDQLIARVMSFDLDAFIVMECTVTTDIGRTWENHEQGSASKIVKPCWNCNQWVAPEREHFTGWETASTEIEAGKNSAFHCPNCGEPWNDKQRFESLKKSKLIHRGQVIKNGKVEGKLPETSTLGFRVSAIDNIFRSSKMLGRLCWKADRSRKRDEAQTAIKQFQFSEPVRDVNEAEPQLDPYETAQRFGHVNERTFEGIVPDQFDVLTCGTDVRNKELHWSVTAWDYDATSRVVQYGTIQVPRNRMPLERAIFAALRHLRGILEKGFPRQNGGEENQMVDQWWIDAGWLSKYIHAFFRESWQLENDFWRNRVYPYIGRGSNREEGKYVPKTKKIGDVVFLGEEFYLSRHKKYQSLYAVVNADFWKAFIHSRLRAPMFQVDEETGEETGESTKGAMTLCELRSGNHDQFIRHICAEHEEKVFEPGKPEKLQWKTDSRANHWFDSMYASAAAASFMGVEAAIPIIPPARVLPAGQVGPGQVITPYGQEYSFN